MEHTERMGMSYSEETHINKITNRVQVMYRYTVIGRYDKEISCWKWNSVPMTKKDIISFMWSRFCENKKTEKGCEEKGIPLHKVEI